MKKEKTLTWVAIGDSFTYINDHLEETGDRLKKGYLDYTKDLLPFKTNLINLGINGSRTETWVNEPLAKGDFYTILLGTNDWWNGSRAIGDYADFLGKGTEITILGNLGIIIRNIKKINNKAKIFVLNPIERGTFVYIHDINNRALDSTHKNVRGYYVKDVAKAIYENVKGENIFPINLHDEAPFTSQNAMKFFRVKRDNKIIDLSYEEFHKDPFKDSLDIYPYPKEAMGYMCDGLHPTDEGYQIIASILSKYLIKEFVK